MGEKQTCIGRRSQTRNATMKIPTILLLGLAAILLVSAEDVSTKETSQLEKLELMMKEMADMTKVLEGIEAKKDAPKVAPKPASTAKDEKKEADTGPEKAEKAAKPAPVISDEEKKAAEKTATPAKDEKKEKEKAAPAVKDEEKKTAEETATPAKDKKKEKDVEGTGDAGP